MQAGEALSSGLRRGLAAVLTVRLFDLLRALSSLAVGKNLVALADEGVSVAISGTLYHSGPAPPAPLG